MDNKYNYDDNKSQMRLCDSPIFSTHNTAINRKTVQFDHFEELIGYTENFPVCIELDIQSTSKKDLCEIGHRGFMGKGKATVRKTSVNINKTSYDSNIDIIERINTIINIYENIQYNRFPLIITFDIRKTVGKKGKMEESKCLETIRKLYEYIGSQNIHINPFTQQKSDNNLTDELLDNCMNTIIVRLKNSHMKYIKKSDMGLKYPYIQVTTKSYSVKKSNKKTKKKPRSSMTDFSEIYSIQDYTLPNELYPRTNFDLGMLVLNNEEQEDSLNIGCNIVRVYPSSHNFNNQKKISQAMYEILLGLFDNNNELKRVFGDVNMIAFNYFDLTQEQLEFLRIEFTKFYSRLYDGTASTKINRDLIGTLLYTGGGKKKSKTMKKKFSRT